MLITKKSFQDPPPPPPLTEFSGSVHWDHIVFGVDSISVTVLGISYTNHHFLTKFAKYRVPTSSGNHGKPGKSQKSYMHGKIMEFEKKN